MAAHTERIIMETFQQMLVEMPFYKITVSTLVKRCGISPNTFYYHYRDIYELLEVWSNRWLSRFSPQGDWRINARAFLRECQENRTLITHIINYLSREQIESVMFSTDEDDLFYITAKSYAAGLSIPERKLHNIADFCRYAFIGFFLQFIWEHMEADVDQIVDDLDTYLRCFMVSALSVESSRSLQKN